MGIGFATGFIQFFASLITLAFFAVGVFVLVLVIKLLTKANVALDLWIKNNSNNNSNNNT
jgi:hypothetical protein